MKTLFKHLKKQKNKWKDIDMTKSIIHSFLVLAIFFANVVYGDSKDLSQSQTQDLQECNLTRESALIILTIYAQKSISKQVL